MKKSLKRSLYIILLFFLATIFIIVGVLSIFDAQYRQYQERVQSNNVIMSKIKHSIDSSFSVKWEKIHRVANRLDRLQPFEINDIASLLDDIYYETIDDNNMNNGAEYYVIDDDGYMYGRNGTERMRWNETKNLNLEPGEDIFILKYPPLGSNQDKQVIYITALKNTLVMKELNIKYVVTTEEMRNLDKMFDITNYGDNCLAFIMSIEGDYIYENQSGNDMAEGWNLLSFIEENLVFEYGNSYELFYKDLTEGKSGTSLVSYNGSKYYFSYTDLAIDKWISIVLVPEENIEAAAGSYSQNIFLDIVYVFVSGFCIITIIFYFMWRKTITKQKLAVEAERASNEAKTNFLSSMSHDIRTPMNAIIGLTEIALSRKDVPKDIQDDLKKINYSSAHLLTLINDILDISKIESGKMALSISEYSANEAITNIVSMIRPLVKSKEIDFRVNIHGEFREYIKGDILRVNQICINLLTNAIKYTHERGKVELDFYQEAIPNQNDKILKRIVVKDNGIGMSEDFQELMYNSFVRETDSRVNKVAGSGLGLAICKQMVQLMEGTIECESKMGVGTTFTVTVVQEKGKEDEVYELSNMKILIFDNDPKSLETLKEILERLKVIVEVIADYDEFILELEKESFPKYDGAFIELSFPDKSGLELSKSLLAHFGKDFPVILTSVYDMSDFNEEIKSAGIKWVMNKPYLYIDIYNKINEVILNNKDNQCEAKSMVEPMVDKLHLLVCEDNDMNWEVISAILNMYKVTTDRAENGKVCLDILSKASDNVYDAIFMDIRMPVMDGLDCTRRIRKSSKDWLKRIPIIAMTADAFAEDIQACLDAGMNKHISKPIELSKIIKILKEIESGYLINNN